MYSAPLKDLTKHHPLLYCIQYIAGHSESPHLSVSWPSLSVHFCNSHVIPLYTISISFSPLFVFSSSFLSSFLKNFLSQEASLISHWKSRLCNFCEHKVSSKVSWELSWALFWSVFGNNTPVHSLPVYSVIFQDAVEAFKRSFNPFDTHYAVHPRLHPPM